MQHRAHHCNCSRASSLTGREGRMQRLHLLLIIREQLLIRMQRGGTGRRVTLNVQGGGGTGRRVTLGLTGRENGTSQAMDQRYLGAANCAHAPDYKQCNSRVYHLRERRRILHTHSPVSSSGCKLLFLLEVFHG